MRWSPSSAKVSRGGATQPCPPLTHTPRGAACCPMATPGTSSRRRVGTAAVRRDVYRGLFSALSVQFQNETLPWIEDLVCPLLAEPPQPLTDTVDPEDLADPDSRFVRVNGVNLHYKEYLSQPQLASDPQASDQLPSAPQAPGQLPSGQSSSCPNMLMLHGFNGSEFNWRLVAPPLTDHVASLTWDSSTDLQGLAGSAAPPACRAVAYDRPPFGLSGRPLTWDQGPDTDPFTLSGGVEMARGLVSSLGLGPVVVMGHSAGAPVALELAARYPELVAGVVLVAPAVATDSGGNLRGADIGRLLRFALIKGIVSTDGPGLNYVRRQLRKREAEVREGRLGVFLDDSKFAQQEVIDNYLRPMKAHDWDKASLNVFRASSPGGPVTAWEDVKAPVLIVHGERDTTVPVSVGRAVAQALRGARTTGGPPVDLVELPECEHLPMEEQPEQFVAAVSTWLTRAVLPAVRQPQDTAGVPSQDSGVEGRGAVEPPQATPEGREGEEEEKEVELVLGSLGDAVDPAR